MSQGDDLRGCSGTARVLMALILVVALIGIALAIYTFTGGQPPANRMTPGGANYNPGQSDAVTAPPKR